MRPGTCENNKGRTKTQNSKPILKTHLLMMNQETKPGHDDKEKKWKEISPHILFVLPCQENGKASIAVKFAKIKSLLSQAFDGLFKAEPGSLGHVLGVLDNRPV